MSAASERPHPRPYDRAAPATAVLDTNVVLAWLLFRDPRIDALGRAIDAGHLTWLASEQTVTEALHMLRHASLAHWPGDRNAAAASIRRLARIEPAPIPGRTGWPRCSDADDQHFIDLALACSVNWLISRDRAVLKLRRRLAPLGVAVIAPEHWPGPA